MNNLTNLLHLRLYKTLKRYDNLDYLNHNNYDLDNYRYWRIKTYQMFKNYNNFNFYTAMIIATYILENYSDIASHICILSYSIYISDYNTIICNLKYIFSDYEYIYLYKREYKITNISENTCQNMHELHKIKTSLKNSRLEYLKYILNRNENLLKNICNNININSISDDLLKKLLKLNPYFISYNKNDNNINFSLNYNCDICLNKCEHENDTNIIKCIGCGSLRHFNCIKNHFYECALCRRSYTYYKKSGEKLKNCLYKEIITTNNSDNDDKIIKNNFLDKTMIIYNTYIHI